MTVPVFTEANHLVRKPNGFTRVLPQPAIANRGDFGTNNRMTISTPTTLFSVKTVNQQNERHRYHFHFPRLLSLA